MSKNKLVTGLENLTAEELRAVQNVIGNILKIKDKNEEAPTPVKTSKRKQRRKSEKVPDEQLDEPKPQRIVRPASRSEPVRTGNRKVAQSNNRRGQGRGRTIAVAQSVDTSGNRPNNFLKDPAFNAAKADSKIDKVLNRGRQPTPRREEVNLIEAECSDCGDVYEVPPTFVYMDDEGSNFVCDRCQRRKRK